MKAEEIKERGHLLVLMTYGALTLLANGFDILMVIRLNVHLHIFVYYLSVVQDVVTILFFLCGLIMGTFTFLGMTKNTLVGLEVFLYVVVGLLGASTIAVIIALELVLQAKPQEFIDVGSIIEMVYCGYKSLKWVMVLSFVTCLVDHLNSILPNATYPSTPMMYLPQPRLSYPMQPMPIDQPSKVMTPMYPGFEEM